MVLLGKENKSTRQSVPRIVQFTRLVVFGLFVVYSLGLLTSFAQFVQNSERCSNLIEGNLKLGVIEQRLDCAPILLAKELIEQRILLDQLRKEQQNLSSRLDLDQSQLRKEQQSLSKRLDLDQFQLRTEQQSLSKRLDLQLQNVAANPSPPQHTVRHAANEGANGVDCEFVFFLGGGKSGSTNLAAWLKHSKESKYREYTPASGFLDSGKEICFGKQKQKSVDRLLASLTPRPSDEHSCPKDRNYVLDACPSFVGKPGYQSLASVVPLRHSKYIVLVRDPVDRIVSHHNDHRQRIRKPLTTQEIDKLVANSKMSFHEGLSKFGEILDGALASFPRDKILVVVNEIMKTNPQQVMDDVCDFLEIPRRIIDVAVPHANALNHRPDYSVPSDEGVRVAQDRFWSDTKKFLQLLNVERLPWKIVDAQVGNITASVSGPPAVRIAGYSSYYNISY